MEKVKITVEQELALKEFNRNDRTISFFVANKKDWHGVYESLKNFTIQEFALLLCGWYEVEQPFKVGDWVLEANNQYRKIQYERSGMFYIGDGLEVNKLWLTNNYEKVTEPYKIMLLELGREKPEFDKNDIIVTEHDVFEGKWHDQDEIAVLFERDLVTAFHPAEDRIEVKADV